MKRYTLVLIIFIAFSSRAQEGKTNSILEKVTFKKLNNGKNFHFLINNKRVGSYCKNGYMNNNLLVFYTTKKQLYICRDFKNKEDNLEYTAEKATVNTENGFWFKTKSGGVNVYNKDGVYIKKSIVYRYETNKIDVKYRGQFETNTLLLENFKNAKPYTLNPIKLHEDSFKTEKLMESLSSFKYNETKNSKGNNVKGFFKNDLPNGPIKIVHKNGITEFSNYKESYKSTKGAIFKEFTNGNFEIIDNIEQVSITYIKDKEELQVLNQTNNQTKIIPFKNKVGCLIGYDCENGIGAYKYENDAIYIGSFKDNQRHGYGRLAFKSGQTYIGEFNKNFKNGIGSFLYSNGDYYLGEWKNDQLHGLGTYYFTNSPLQAGIWDNGVYIKSLGKTNTNYVANNVKKNNSNASKSTFYNSTKKVTKNTIAKKEVIRKTIEGLTVFPESGSLRTLSAEAADMNSIEYKLGNVGSYNGTPEGVAIISSCDLDRKIVFIKSTKNESNSRGDYYFSYKHTEYYVSIINGKYQHEKVMFLGRDTYKTQTHMYNSNDHNSGYLASGITLNWSMNKDIFTIRSNRNRNYKVNMSKCTKI